MFWKRIRNDLQSHEMVGVHDRPSTGSIGIGDLSGNVGAVGWAFNGMNR